MNSPDKDWWIAQSGEYVLGTLTHADWVTFRKAAEHDEDAQRLIREWEQTFQPLADSLKPVTPASHVWKAIEAQISGEQITPNASNVVSMDTYNARAKTLETRLDRWRTIAGLASVASILLASLAWITHIEVRDQIPAVPVAAITQFDSIAIIRNEESLPLWVVDSSLADGLVRVTAIAPPAIGEENSYQLWLVKPDNAGVQSMGLIPDDVDQSLLLKVETGESAAVAFAVSLEPAGGSPEDVPTGPVLFQGVVQELEL